MDPTRSRHQRDDPAPLDHNSNKRTVIEQRRLIKPGLIYIFSLYIIALASLNVAPVVSIRAPTFIKDMSGHAILENTRIGEEIYTLEAVDLDGLKVVYGVEDTNLFGVDKYTGRVKVINNIDFESTGANVKLIVTATNVPSQQQSMQKIQPITVKMNIDVNILDENDNTPKISTILLGENEPVVDQLVLQQKKPLKLDISEDTPPGTILIEQIVATDRDTVGEPLTPICLQCEPELELVQPAGEGVSSHKTVFAMRTKNLISYTPKNNIRLVNMIVTDGKYNATLKVEITIINKQNKPPIFTGSTTAVVAENVSIDTTILTIQAIDGDAIGDLQHQIDTDHHRQVVYTLVDPNLHDLTTNMINPRKYFRLDPITGDLQVANRLDREEFLSTHGIITFEVQATEVTITKPLENAFMARANLLKNLDNGPTGSSKEIIRVILTDVNDNAPQWLNSSDMIISKGSIDSQQQPVVVFNQNRLGGLVDTGRMYQVNIDENSQPGTPLALLDMFIQDLDSGNNSIYKIQLIDPSKKFDVEPKFAHGFTSVSLRLASFEQQGANGDSTATLLDYENPNERKFVLQVVATETSTYEAFSSTATVIVNVININDNAPEFKDQFYRANVKEDSLPGRSVLSIKATDKDSSPITYSLVGHSAHLFNINPQTGLITVARCDGPAKCIDYESNNQHYILVQASDGELNSSVPLIIHVEDANDNPPVMLRKIFEAVIEEGSERFEPPLKVEAKDDDLTSVISYSIAEGNFEGLFAINNGTGEVQLTRKIKIGSNHNGENRLKLIVRATDGIFSSNATVLISILDSNDNAPIFLKKHYSLEIPENIEERRDLIQLTAHDADTGSNALLSYKIQRGSFGMFGIDENRGVLYVEDGVKFDIEKRSEYNLEVVAMDHGITSKTGTAMVHIRVLNVNNKPPIFTPAIQRVEISENVPIQTIIHRLQASDPDIEQAKLKFTPEVMEALDKYGNAVRDTDILTRTIGLDADTGDVFVNSKLNHDQLAFVNLTVSVTEFTQTANQSIGSPNLNHEEYGQKSYGYLLIVIKDFNDNPPSFAAPWLLLKPELHFKMDEERPIGSILTQLVASDPDSRISYFKIEPPNEYFELSSPQSGLIVTKQIIDYEELMAGSDLDARDGNQTRAKGNNIVQFSVSVYDSGVPLLSARSTIYVEIIPINDWDCKFNQSSYTASIKEHSPEGTFVVQTEAHDGDFGPQGQLTYYLVGENNDLFSINPITGAVVVNSKGSMIIDHERMQSPTLIVHAIAVDNQRNGPQENFINDYHQESRTCSVSIKVIIEDINDNPPKFSQRVYETIAYNGDFSMVPIIKLSIKDSDADNDKLLQKNPTAQNSYKILSGNTNDIFNISNQGVIYATKSLNSTKNTDIQYNLKVEVRQHQATSIFSDECDVKINIIPMNRFSPEFVAPINGVAYVNESAPVDQWVTQIRCIDKDQDYDEIAVSKSGLDEDRSRGANYDKAHFIRSEKLRYYFKVNGQDAQETDEFTIDPRSGNITTKVSLDREAKPYYDLIVACNDDGHPQALETVWPITVYVLDIDDNRPEFILTTHQRQQNKLRQQQLKLTNPLKSSQSYTPLTIEFQVDEKQGRNMIVGEIKAIDQDESSRLINYCIIDGNEYQEFHLDRPTGVLYANQTLDREKQSSYTLVIKAINDGLSCEDHMNNDISRSLPSKGTTFSGNSMTTNTPSLHGQQKGNLFSYSPASMNSINGRDNSILIVKIHVNDVNDNKPIFKKYYYRAGVKHRALVNTMITQVPAYDPDNGINGTVSYTISEVLLYKRQNQGQDGNNNDMLSLQGMMSMQQKPTRLVQNPFKIDHNGYVYTTQLLTQYPLASMFLVSVEAHERVNPWRIATTKLEIWTYENYNQVRIKVNMSPKTIELYKEEIEALMSNMTKYGAIINDIKSYYDTNQWIAASNDDNLSKINRNLGSSSGNNYILNINQHKTTNFKFDANHLIADSNMNTEEATSSNLYMIFVDENNRLINPQTVIEKFDSSSAHLLLPHDSNQNVKDKSTLDGSGNHHRGPLSNVPIPEPFIDKIALASSQMENMQQFSMLNGDMLDLATLLVIVIGFLVFFGLIMTCIGCCCLKNWYRNHILRNATKKLIKQHAIQVKINEQMLAAATLTQQQQDFMSASSANMTSLDAINCTNNNNDNISIIRAAMNTNINPPLQGIVNQGANFYDGTNNAASNINTTNNGIATIRGGLTNAQRRQQLPSDDPSLQNLEKNIWNEDQLSVNNNIQ